VTSHLVFSPFNGCNITRLCGRSWLSTVLRKTVFKLIRGFIYFTYFYFIYFGGSSFFPKGWSMEHTDMTINEVVVMYLNDDQVSRPTVPPIVTPCKGIMSCFSFLFLGVSRHYVRRSYSCWCMVYSRVRDRGNGSKSYGSNLVVQDCTRTKQTFGIEDQSVVTSSSGIRDHDTRVPEIVVRELQKTKPDKWGYVQSHDLWSSKEETYVCPGHH
jgi:hypothetical protein